MPHRSLTLAILLLVAIAIFVALPALIAILRRHPERQLIVKLSPLSFFSLILWFALIAWAVTGNQDDATISRYVAKLRRNNRLPLVITTLVLVGLVGSVVTFVL
ncbi:MAG: hypothetical protein ABIQ32_00840 [Sphingomicrobium sp.]